MPSQIRIKRISDRFKQELSEMILLEIQDPRLSTVSITDVKVDRELAYADIYVSAIEGQQISKEVLEGLEHAKSFISRLLAARVNLRIFPRLRFHWDPTPENADHIERLFSLLREEKKSNDENTE